MNKLTMEDPQIINGCQIRYFMGSRYDHTYRRMYHIADGINITM